MAVRGYDRVLIWIILLYLERVQQLSVVRSREASGSVVNQVTRSRRNILRILCRVRGKNAVVQPEIDHFGSFKVQFKHLGLLGRVRQIYFNDVIKHTRRSRLPNVVPYLIKPPTIKISLGGVSQSQ